MSSGLRVATATRGWVRDGCGLLHVKADFIIPYTFGNDCEKESQ